jgi:transposase
MTHKKGTDRNQLLLLPPTLDDFIQEDNPVRVIEAFVDALDLGKLRFEKVRCRETGCPSYDPGDLLKLYMYGYSNRIRTSRKLERECTRNIEVMWLIHNMRPSARTIAYFRSDNKKALKRVFRQFILLTKQWDLIEGKLLSSDGSKLRAVNSKKNNYSQKKIDLQLGRIDAKIQEYLKELDRNDREENGKSKEDIKKTLLELNERRKKYERLEKQLESTGEDQISTTDPQSRLLLIRGHITEVSYNVQTTVDSKHNLIVDVKAINTSDRKMASVMGRRAKAILGKGNFDYLLDKGYHDGESIDECARYGIRTLIPPPAASRSGEIPTKEFYNDKFKYDPIADCYTCPAGQLLTTNGNSYNLRSWSGRTEFKQYKTRSCNSCASRNKCTSSAEGRGRIIPRSIFQGAVEENNSRVKREKKKYLLRQQMVEHPYGIVKRQWGYDHVLLKGIDKAEAESNLIFLCYNLKRVINILGINALIKKLRAFALFFTNFDLKIHAMPNQLFLRQKRVIKNWFDLQSSIEFKTLILFANF